MTVSTQTSDNAVSRKQKTLDTNQADLRVRFVCRPGCRAANYQLSGRQEPHPLTAHLGASGNVGQATALRVMNIQVADDALHMRVDF